MIERVRKGYEMTYASVVSVARENQRESGNGVSDGLRSEGHT